MEMSRNKRERTTTEQGQDGRGGSTTLLEKLDSKVVFAHIFPLLPVFTLLQLKLVCKACHDLVLQYREDTADKPREPSLLILAKNLSRLHLWDKELETTLEIKSPAKKPRDRMDIVLSCHGLLCIQSSPEHSTWSLKFQVCIYNPLTRMQHLLPYLEMIRQPIYHYFGFGFRRGTSEYKVVGITGIASAGNNQVMHRVVAITVSKLGFWRPVVAEKPVAVFDRSSDVVVDGSIYWLCKERQDSVFWRVVVSFDLAEEKFHQIGTPPVLEIGFASVLAVLGGRLVLTNPQMTTQRLDIWMLNKDGARQWWTWQYHIRTNVLSVALIRPVCLLKNGCIVVSYNDKALYVYDPDRWRFEPVATSLLGLRQFKVIQYNPVLFSPS